jgi:hypothetical protein
MGWVDQRYEQYKEAVSHRDAVKLVADEMYLELWKAILEIVQSDSLRGMNLRYNGSPLNHQVKMGERTVTVKLDQDKCGITATVSDGPSVELKLRFCGDAQGGSICIKHRGTNVDYATAARTIMEPFLFEEASPYAFLFPDA